MTVKESPSCMPKKSTVHWYMSSRSAASAYGRLSRMMAPQSDDSITDERFWRRMVTSFCPVVMVTVSFGNPKTT